MAAQDQTSRSPHKNIAVFDEEGKRIWRQLELKIRAEYDANSAREGEVAAQAFAAYLGCEGPLDRVSEE